MSIQIRPITQEDQAWIARKLTENWGAPLVISRGKSNDASKLPGFVAMQDNDVLGWLHTRLTIRNVNW